MSLNRLKSETLPLALVWQMVWTILVNTDISQSLHGLPKYVITLRRFSYREVASSSAIHDVLTHPLLRFGYQMLRVQSQRGMRCGISSQTKLIESPLKNSEYVTGRRVLSTHL